MDKQIIFLLYQEVCCESSPFSPDHCPSFTAVPPVWQSYTFAWVWSVKTSQTKLALSVPLLTMGKARLSISLGKGGSDIINWVGRTKYQIHDQVR